MLTLTPTCSSITTTWTAPSDPGNPPFKYYTIKLNESEADRNRLDKNQTSYNFTGLRAGTKYKVAVTVNSDIFMSETANHTSTEQRSK